MSIARRWPALALALCSTPLNGADLTRIDRKIAKEPAYQGKPAYCLLVFGPQAANRVWLVQDGNTLYIDRNGNGNLTEAGKKVAWGDKSCAAGAITGPDGAKLAANVLLRKYTSGMRLSLQYEGKDRYMVGDPDGEALVFGDHPTRAPVVHIGGRLAIELSYYGLGTGSMALRVRVGSPGLRPGSFAALVLPEVAPVAEIEFPASKPGGPPIVAKATLKDR